MENYWPSDKYSSRDPIPLTYNDFQELNVLPGVRRISRALSGMGVLTGLRGVANRTRLTRL